MFYEAGKKLKKKKKVESFKGSYQHRELIPEPEADTVHACDLF